MRSIIVYLFILSRKHRLYKLIGMKTHQENTSGLVRMEDTRIPKKFLSGSKKSAGNLGWLL
jgi:hypothetical protein